MLMNEETKITLSEKELQLVCDTEWILTKHIIIEKVYRLFGKLAESMQSVIRENGERLPAEVCASTAKISKGENYRQLPYVMLDYPRHFNKVDVLAIRTLFWWGSFFSINLHLSGSFKTNVEKDLIAGFPFFQENDYWICVNEDPWQHHFEKDNYLLLKHCKPEDLTTIINSRSFIKIAKKIPLTRWTGAAVFIENTFLEMTKLIELNYPTDGKGLSPGTPITGSDL